MDERTAYEILKIRQGTSIDEISKRHDHFVRLYKHYMMGERLYISPEEIEKMKAAYESLLYKRIEEDELPLLYPQESNSRCYQTYDKIICPIFKRHKSKIVYTIAMSVLTFIIIFIMNYRPIDFRVHIITQPSSTVLEDEARLLSAEAYKTELTECLPGIKKPWIEYQSFSPLNGMTSALVEVYTSDKADVYLMEESVLIELKKAEKEFVDSEKTLSEVYISKDTNLYKEICDPNSENKAWVAVVSPISKHKEQALDFIRLVGSMPLK